MPQATPSATIRRIKGDAVRYTVSRSIQIDLSARQRLAIKPRTERSFPGRPPVAKSEIHRADLPSTVRDRPYLLREPGHQDHASQQPEDSRDIIIDDLRTTIEAHRSTNTASILRKIASDTPPTSDFKRIFVPNVGAGYDVDGVQQSGVPIDQTPLNVEDTKVKKPPCSEIWKEKEIATRNKPQVDNSRSTEKRVQDYEGKILGPMGQWALRYTSKEHLRHSDRPWLAYLQNYDGDGQSQ